MIKALYECAIKEGPSNSNEKSFQSPIDDELTFGLVDIIQKKFQEMANKVRCIIGIVGQVIGEGELKNVYDDFKYDVKELLHTDVQQCVETKGLTTKLK